MFLEDSIMKIKNVGEERTKKLHKLNIFTIKDLIEYFPRDYKDRSHVVKINEIVLNEINTFKAIVCEKPECISVKNIIITKVKVKDETGFIYVVWFHQPYLKNSLLYKGEYIFTGKVLEKYGKIQVESPDYELINDKELLSNGRIIPIYSLTENFSQKVFRKIIKDTLNEIYSQVEEFLPEDIMSKYNLCKRDFAVENIHFPKNDDSFLKARKRLVFEELFLIQFRLIQLKGYVKNKSNNVIIKNLDIKNLIQLLSFKLTDAQYEVLNDIICDFKSPFVMNRLIQGDVGSGKTVIAMIACFIIIQNNYQSVLMVPTDVLARQHYNSFNDIFEKLNIKCALLCSKMKKKEKEEVYRNIADGTVKMIIGTHAVIQDNVIYKNLGLAITDEQHRFGVVQRSILSEKGNNPHILVMSATPIPRTLALILYGDLDISIINQMPPGRKEIDTISVNSNYYERVYNFIKKNADNKRQSYIICPMIEKNDKMELKSVKEYTLKLKKEIFYNYRVECIHGKMKNTEKEIIMSEFANGNIDILVSTTVIEVGINVSNATIMVIENAERFGLSQLHQLRGRVGRGSEQSYCILISDSKSDISKERINIMKNHSDGFEISEKDLKLRGPGDFFGTRQHGIPEFKIANLYKDIEILKMAQKAVNELYEADSQLNNKKNYMLKSKLFKLFDCENEKVLL